MRRWPKIRSFRYYYDAFFPSHYFGEKKESVHIPVFMFHDLDPVKFENQLLFLKMNGYIAISCEQSLWDCPNPKHVILTFDDGLRSVWTIAFPLLRKHGLKGTAFISPNNISDGRVTPNLENTSVDKLAMNDFGNSELFNGN